MAATTRSGCDACSLRIVSASFFTAAAEEASTWNIASDQRATSFHEPYSVTCTLSQGSNQSGVSSSRSMAATFARSQVSTRSAPRVSIRGSMPGSELRQRSGRAAGK
jgi:hypothetical protein